MRLTFLGTGAAFTEDDNNFQSNMFVESSAQPKDGGRSGLLIDAGTDVRRSMKAQGLCYLSVDTVYVSHVHADHIGGLEWLGFKTYFDANATRPKLVATPRVRRTLWDQCLRGGMEGLDFGPASLETYFDVSVVEEGEAFHWGDASFTTVRMPHFVTGGKEWSSYGLMIETETRSTFLTTDSLLDIKRAKPFYEKADLILQDCETSEMKSGAHAHYSELKHLPAEIKSKMLLYHYSDGTLPDHEADGFLGFARPGQVIDLV